MKFLILLHTFLTLALDEDQWLTSQPSHFTLQEKATNINWISIWVGPTANVNLVAKRNILPLPGTELTVQPIAHHFTEKP
jgi:hypothetical protein